MKGKKIKATLLIAIFILSTLAIATQVSAVGPTAVWVDDGFIDEAAVDIFDVTLTLGIDAFDTIQGGIDAVAEEGTVNVVAGTYTEKLIITKPLMLIGEGTTRPKVDIPGAVGAGVTITASDVTIENIHFYRLDQTQPNWDNCIISIPRGGRWEAYTIDYERITFRNVLFEGAHRGTYIAARDVTVEDCEFENQASDALFFSSVSGTTNILRNTFSGDALTGKAIVFENFASCDPATSGTINIKDNTLTGKTTFVLYNQWIDLTKKVTLNIISNTIDSICTLDPTIWIYDDGVIDIFNLAPDTNLGKFDSITVSENNFLDAPDGRYVVKNRSPDITVDATLNWWGTTVQSEVADMVSGLTDFNPWLPEDVETSYSDDDEDGFLYYEEVALGTDPNDPDDYPGASVEEYLIEDVSEGIGTVDATDEANTEVDYEATEDTTITVSKYKDNPEEDPSGFSASGEYIDVRVDEPENLDSITIKLHYSDETGEDHFRMYYWDGSNWVQCSNTGVNTVLNFIWAVIDSTTRPDLSYLSGGPFGGGDIKVELDSEWYKTGDTVDVLVEDAAEEGIIMVQAKSTTIDPLYITIALHETETGIFTGDFLLVDYTPGAGELLAEHGDTITVTYLLGIGYEALIDDLEPIISDLSPADESYKLAKPTISATLDDIDSGIDFDTAVMKVDGVSVEILDPEADFSYTPLEDLTEGIHTVTVDVSDMVGNAAETAEWSFTVDTEIPLIEDAEATPPVVYPDTAATIIFTATVTDATSGIESVTIELGSIGGALEPMLDDGEDPDLVEADGVYTVSLTTEGLDEKDYVLTVTATDKAGLTATETIDFASTPDTEPPVITEAEIAYPVGVVSARFEDPIIISATVTDNVVVDSVTLSDDLETPLIENVQMKDDGLLDDEVEDDGIYTATIPELPEYAPDTYELTITAADDKGNEATEIILLEVTTKLTGYYVDLEGGWNIFSLPLIPDDSSVEVVLADVMENVEIVWGYKDDAWSSYLPAIPEFSTLTDMVDGEGYWVKMTAVDTLTVSGVELPGPGILPPVYSVYEGWNLIGFKSVAQMPVDNYLTTIPQLVKDSSVCYGWDATVQEYDIVYLAGGLVDEGFNPGQGYWLYLTEDANIAPP